MNNNYAFAVEATTRAENMDTVRIQALNAFHRQLKDIASDPEAEQRLERMISESHKLLYDYFNTEQASNFETMVIVMQHTATWLHTAVDAGMQHEIHEDAKEFATGVLAAFSSLLLKCVSKMIDEDEAKKATE